LSNSLDYFELQFSEQVVLEGEMLYDQQAVKDLLQVEKSLWIALVEDAETYEVELLKPQRKSRQFTCDCTHFKKHGECKHIIAAFFAFRSKIRSIEEGKKKPRKTSSRHFNLNLILEQVSKEDLVRFLKSYGKKDKKFATLVKAHFARSVSGTFNNRYKTILQSVIKPVQTAEVNIGAAQVKHYVQVCTELTDQLEDAIVLEDYRESIQIWQSCLSMNEYVMHYTSFQASDVQKLAFRLSTAFKTLLQAEMSPELRQELIQSSLEIATRSYYHYKQVSTNILELVYQSVGPVSNWTEKLLENIEELLPQKDGEELLILTSLKMRLLYRTNTPINVSQLVDAFGKDITLLIKNIVTSTDYECAVHMCKKIVEVYPEKTTLNAVLVEVYQYQSNIDGIRKLAFDMLVSSHESRYFDMLKEHTPSGEWAGIKKQALQLIDKVKVRTELLTRDEDWDGLLKVLNEENDLNLTMKYTYRLNLNRPSELAELYEGQLRDYLKNHIGTKAGAFFKEVLLHLETVGALTSIKRIYKLLDREFPHRTASVAR
jgi:hypothetical protein